MGKANPVLLVSLAELDKMTNKAKLSFWRQIERMTQLQVGVDCLWGGMCEGTGYLCAFTM